MDPLINKLPGLLEKLTLHQMFDVMDEFTRDTGRYRNRKEHELQRHGLGDGKDHFQRGRKIVEKYNFLIKQCEDKFRAYFQSDTIQRFIENLAFNTEIGKRYKYDLDNARSTDTTDDRMWMLVCLYNYVITKELRFNKKLMAYFTKHEPIDPVHESTNPIDKLPIFRDNIIKKQIFKAIDEYNTKCNQISVTRHQHILDINSGLSRNEINKLYNDMDAVVTNKFKQYMESDLVQGVIERLIKSDKGVIYKKLGSSGSIEDLDLWLLSTVDNFIKSGELRLNDTIDRFFAEPDEWTPTKPVTEEMDPILIFKTFQLKKELLKRIMLWRDSLLKARGEIQSGTNPYSNLDAALVHYINQPSIESLIKQIILRTPEGQSWLKGKLGDDDDNWNILNKLILLTNRSENCFKDPELNTIFKTRKLQRDKVRQQEMHVYMGQLVNDLNIDPNLGRRGHE